MGSTGGFVAGLFGQGPQGNAARVKKLQSGAVQNAQDANAAFAPPVIPPLPDVKKQNAAAGMAMTNAALAQRRKAASAGGFASTILTSPTGAPPAVTAKKQLIGL